MMLETCVQMGISPQQTIAMGDGANDLPMMGEAGLSVAYHAKPKVREQAMDRILELAQAGEIRRAPLSLESNNHVHGKDSYSPFYPEEIVAFEPEFVQAQQAAYMETCIEDDEIAERMDAGRQALLQRGQNESGPYQSPMEDGMQHFHEWYRKKMQLPD